MTADIYFEGPILLEQQMESLRRKCFILVDYCSAHSRIETLLKLEIVECFYHPQTVTSKI